MNTLPKKIIEKKREVLKLKKVDDNTPFIMDDKKSWAKAVRAGEAYKRSRNGFVRLCIKYRLPYDQIGNLIGITKARVYQIQRYGVYGIPDKNKKKKVLERENYMCLICRKEATKRNPLHVHHIGNPKRSALSNLVSLCASCHRRVDVSRRRNLTKE
jgi:hypothetical protein